MVTGTPGVVVCSVIPALERSQEDPKFKLSSAMQTVQGCIGPRQDKRKKERKGREKGGEDGGEERVGGELKQSKRS